jgi:hypothetical protein
MATRPGRSVSAAKKIICHGASGTCRRDESAITTCRLIQQAFRVPWPYHLLECCHPCASPKWLAPQFAALCSPLVCSRASLSREIVHFACCNWTFVWCESSGELACNRDQNNFHVRIQLVLLTLICCSRLRCFKVPCYVHQRACWHKDPAEPEGCLRWRVYGQQVGNPGIIDLVIVSDSFFRRYLYFAQRADIEGYNDVASVFRSTAEGETGHAHGHLEFLQEVTEPILNHHAN